MGLLSTPESKSIYANWVIREQFTLHLSIDNDLLAIVKYLNTSRIV